MHRFVAIFAFVAFALVTSASRAEEMPFTQAAFDATRASGHPVGVVFHADWCPTCRAQAPLLRELTQSPELKGFTLYIANFDTEKPLRQSLGVNKQSTVVVFKGDKEIARSTGDTSRDGLAALLHQAIS